MKAYNASVARVELGFGLSNAAALRARTVACHRLMSVVLLLFAMPPQSPRSKRIFLFEVR